MSQRIHTVNLSKCILCHYADNKGKYCARELQVKEGLHRCWQYIGPMIEDMREEVEYIKAISAAEEKGADYYQHAK